MSGYIKIATDAGEFQAYLAQPALSVAPAVVVLHEVFGVNADLRQTCEDLAQQGLIALSPDLFWRQSQGVDLNPAFEADWERGYSMYNQYDRDLGVADIAAVMKVAAGVEGSSGKVAVMGYCLGGLMSFLTAARTKVDAAVAFHGADTERYLSEAPNITAPMLMHLAEQDEFIPPEAQAAIKAALAPKANVEIYTYAGCYHAFSRHGGAHFDAKAAALANTRTWAFLKLHLSGAEAAASYPNGASR